MARIVWGAEFQTFDVDFGIPPIIFGNVVIPFKKVFILATSLFLMIALGLYVKKTYIGKAMGATAGASGESCRPTHWSAPISSDRNTWWR